MRELRPAEELPPHPRAVHGLEEEAHRVLEAHHREALALHLDQRRRDVADGEQETREDGEALERGVGAHSRVQPVEEGFHGKGR